MSILLASTLVFLSGSDAFAQGSPAAHDLAADKFRIEVILESAYLFYAAAEMAILFLVLKISRYFQSDRLPDRFAISERDKRTLFAGILVLLFVALVIFGRHLIIVPMPTFIQQLSQDNIETAAAAVREAYTFRARLHLAVFFLFLNAWIILEAAIVWQGVAAYRAMKRVLRQCA